MNIVRITSFLYEELIPRGARVNPLDGPLGVCAALSFSGYVKGQGEFGIQILTSATLSRPGKPTKHLLAGPFDEYVDL